MSRSAPSPTDAPLKPAKAPKREIQLSLPDGRPLQVTVRCGELLAWTRNPLVHVWRLDAPPREPGVYTAYLLWLDGRTTTDRLTYLPKTKPDPSILSPGYEPVRSKKMKLEDTDKMPFGKHHGVPMQDVPAGYLHYLWANGLKDDQRSNVADYIRRNLDALKKEYNDGVWT